MRWSVTHTVWEINEAMYVRDIAGSMAQRQCLASLHPLPSVTLCPPGAGPHKRVRRDSALCSVIFLSPCLPPWKHGERMLQERCSHSTTCLSTSHYHSSGQGLSQDAPFSTHQPAMLIFLSVSYQWVWPLSQETPVPTSTWASVSHNLFVFSGFFPQCGHFWSVLNSTYFS